MEGESVATPTDSQTLRSLPDEAECVAHAPTPNHHLRSPARCCLLSFYHQHGGTCQSQPPDCDAYQWKIVSQKLSDGEPLDAARLEQIFAEMDTDGSGSIDVPELTRALKGVCADTGPVLFMLSSADTNNDGNWDGKLSKEEFRSAMLGPG